jgi:hypothetical protein
MNKTIENFSFCELNYLDWQSDVKELWERAYERVLPTEFANWLFQPFSQNKLYASFNESNKLVGMYSLLKYHVVVHDEIKVAYLCNNVCIDPKEQGKNLFVRLGQYALTDILPRCDFIFGFPNSKAVAGHRKVNWDFHSPLHVYRASALALGTDSPDIELTDFNDSDILDFVDNRAFYSTKSHFILKDNSFFRWRYLDRPQIDRKYIIKLIKVSGRIVGYVVYSVRDSGELVHIIDICARDKRAIKCALSFGRRLASDYNLAGCNILGSASMEEKLMETGYQRSEYYFNFISKSSLIGFSNASPVWKDFIIHWSDGDVF